MDEESAAFLRRGGDDQRPQQSITRNDGRERRIVDHLLLAAVVALVGAVWVLGRSVAVLQASDTYQNERIAEIKADVRETKSDVKEIRGKTFRGVDGYEEPASAANK
jgi:hypothetical protein